MIPSWNIVAHHSESVDPTLIGWIREKIDEIVGLESGTIILLLGVLIVIFPLGLVTLAWRNRRRAERSRKG